MDLLTPLALAINTPTGPFKLSTQPSQGSAQAGVTKICKNNLVTLLFLI